MASFENKFLKKRFTRVTTLQACAERASPLLAMLDKPVQGGASVAEPCVFSGPQGFSYSLSAAQAVSAQTDRGASNYNEFVSTFGEYHGSAVITARAVAGGRTDADAYLRQLTEVMESSLYSFGSIAARKLIGPVGNAIGRISDLDQGGTNGEIELTIRGDAFNFTPGMILQAADGTGNGAPSNVRSGLGYVFMVTPDADGDTSHIKVATSSGSTTAAGPTGWADNDYLFRNGDVAAGSDLSDAQVRSLQSWLTLTASSTQFNGVDRSAHAGLSGFRVSATDVAGLSILDRIQLLVNVGRSEYNAQQIDVCVLGPRTWQQLAQEAQSYGTLTFSENTKIGVKVLTVMTANGPLQVLNEPHCAEADIWVLNTSKVKIYNYDGFPGLDEGDGNQILRQTSSAAYEVRWHAFNCLTVGGQPWLAGGRCNSGN